MSNKFLPTHLAIIMDGSRRWTGRSATPDTDGYTRGAEVANDIAECCLELSIPYLTLYAWSIDNWKSRSKEAFAQFVILLNHCLAKKTDLYHKRQVRLQFIGDLSILPSSTIAMIQEIEQQTKLNTGLILSVAIGYGGRQEIVNALTLMLEMKILATSEAEIKKFLYTKDLPDPDFLIRTGGEKRLSNFFLWQLAYTELHFCDILWPDFSRTHLLEALDEYSSRSRRYGR